MALVEGGIWSDRIESANNYYKKWATRYSCDTLEKYYEGFQWPAQKPDDDRYVINKIFETIQIKLDSFIPSQLKFQVSPAAGSSDFNLELASLSSQIKEDVLNTVISDPEQVFSEECGMAYKDSFFRFGIVEVGYSADWIMNPNAPRPLLNTDVSKDNVGNPKVIKKIPQELPVNERVYFKHIPASTFRVGGIDHKYLHRCGWCGYYEWVDKNDLLALPGVKNKKKLEAIVGQTINDHFAAGDKTGRSEHLGSGNNIKVWHIWDLKTRMRLVITDDDYITISERKFTRLNLFDIRPDKSLITNGFYPIPPVHHWISPQNEINEIREQGKNHRRRFVRKFQVVVGSCDDEEIEKFESGQDGALVKVKRENAISAIQSASLGVDGNNSNVLASDDLNQISGTSAEVRGVADRTTATQANIINQKAATRENAERDRVIKWFARIGRETLLVIRDKFTLGIWAQLTSDPGEQLFGTVQQNKPVYDWVTSEDLNDGYDFRIVVDVTTLSQASQQEEKRKYLEFLSITTQFPQTALSPLLIRENAYRCGYRNEKVIKEMQQMALVHMMGVQAGIMGPAGNSGQQINNNNTPNDMSEITNQLQNQLGVTQ